MSMIYTLEVKMQLYGPYIYEVIRKVYGPYMFKRS